MDFQFIVGLFLVLAGLMYQFLNFSKEVKSLGLGLFIGILLLASSTGTLETLDFDTLNKGLTPVILTTVIASMILAFVVYIKSWNIISWVSLAFPALIFLFPENKESGLDSFAAFQVAGLGAVLPLMVHFITAFMSSFSVPRETPVVIHKQHIALLLGIAILAFFVIVGNFTLGKESYLLLATGIYSTALSFTAYKLNGQRIFPALVVVLDGFYIFQSYQGAYTDSISLNSFQMVSGLLFGMAAIFGTGLTFSWAKDTTGVFSKILLIKSILIPLLFVFLSGWLFFVYEAFGGRTSLVMTSLGAILVLPLVNFLFTNMAYGGLLMVFGMTQILMPNLEHKKEVVEIATAPSDEMQENLKKLSISKPDGSKELTKLNDLTEALGSWKIDGENSIIEFKVHGEESITDGFFKNFSGTMHIDSDYQKSTLNVTIPIAQISTYNRVRDKSIREDAIFFDEAKFPELSYEVKNVVVDTSGYIAEGQFSMKGISAKVPTKFKLKSKGTINGKEAVILEGAGELDRAAFGQTNDEAIGNRVTFNFKVLYLKD